MVRAWGSWPFGWCFEIYPRRARRQLRGFIVSFVDQVMLLVVDIFNNGFLTDTRN